MGIVRILLVLIGLFASSAAFAGKISFAGILDSGDPGCDVTDRSSVCITLLFSGEIEKGDAEHLSREITKVSDKGNEKIKFRAAEILFDSPGGDLYEAMKIGKIIRDHLMATMVTRDSSCSSACVIAYLGGVARMPAGPIGIHSFYSKEFLGPSDYAVASKRYDDVSLQVEAYLKAMRIPVALLDEMKNTPHYNIRILKIEEMQRLGVLGIDPVYAQIRNSNENRTNR